MLLGRGCLAVVGVVEIDTELSATLVNSVPVQAHHGELGRVWRVEFDDGPTGWPVDFNDLFDAEIVLSQFLEHQKAEIYRQVVDLDHVCRNHCGFRNSLLLLRHSRRLLLLLIGFRGLDHSFLLFLPVLGVSLGTLLNLLLRLLSLFFQRGSLLHLGDSLVGVLQRPI